MASSRPLVFKSENDAVSESSDLATDRHPGVLLRLKQRCGVAYHISTNFAFRIRLTCKYVLAHGFKTFICHYLAGP